MHEAKSALKCKGFFKDFNEACKTSLLADDMIKNCKEALAELKRRVRKKPFLGPLTLDSWTLKLQSRKSKGIRKKVKKSVLLPMENSSPTM